MNVRERGEHHQWMLEEKLAELARKLAELKRDTEAEFLTFGPKDWLDFHNGVGDGGQSHQGGA